ncbi:MAG: hypothetical protein PHT69_16320 [Bacteroidales bacterium]|nr:hypothetical protein [Bacteroidales bacterium]
MKNHKLLTAILLFLFAEAVIQGCKKDENTPAPVNNTFISSSAAKEALLKGTWNLISGTETWTGGDMPVSILRLGQLTEIQMTLLSEGTSISGS